jgi:tetratricopeptide (TPR) repeat protein
MKKNRVLIWIVFFLVVTGGCATIKEKVDGLFGPKDKELVQAYMQSGQEHENKGNIVEALKQYKLALTVDPQNKEAIEKSSRLEKKMHVLAEEHYREGLKLNNKGKYKSARLNFLKSLELQPDHSGALRALKPRKQILAKRFVVHTIKPGESLSIVAKIYYGDYKKFPIIAKFNNMSDATQIKVGQKIKVPEIEGTLSLAKKPDVETEDVKISDSIDLDQEIKQEQVEIIKKDEDREDIAEQVENYRNLGIELFKDKEYQAAISEFNKVLNVNSDDKIALAYLSNTHFRQGIILFEKEDYLEAEKNFEASYRYNKNCEKCQDYINKSQEAYKKIHYNRGLSYFGKQQLPEAIREWELVYAVDPNYKEVEKDINKAKTLLKRLEQIKKSLQESQIE